MQSSRWAPVLRPKTRKTLFEPVNFSVFIYVHFFGISNKFKDLIWTSKFKFSFRELYLNSKFNMPLESEYNISSPFLVTVFLEIFEIFAVTYSIYHHITQLGAVFFRDQTYGPMVWESEDPIVRHYDSCMVWNSDSYFETWNDNVKILCA